MDSRHQVSRVSPVALSASARIEAGGFVQFYGNYISQLGGQVRLGLSNDSYSRLAVSNGDSHSRLAVSNDDSYSRLAVSNDDSYNSRLAVSNDGSHNCRALAVRRKADAQREEKRRKQILAKRREKQQEATERYQRAPCPSRPSSGTSGESVYISDILMIDYNR
jgi:hypothetical protein